ISSMERAMIVNSADGFAFSALSLRAENPIGGVVVLQEIFGLTDHIADMAALFAAAGYNVIAPSLFDRVESNFQAGMDPDGVKKGQAAVAASPWAQVTGDIQAAIDAL